MLCFAFVLFILVLRLMEREWNGNGRIPWSHVAFFSFLGSMSSQVRFGEVVVVLLF